MRTGRRYVSPGAAATLLMPPAPATHDQLTPCQLELSIKTVNTHRHQICQRLGVHDVAGLVRYAIRHHLARAE